LGDVTQEIVFRQSQEFPLHPVSISYAVEQVAPLLGDICFCACLSPAGVRGNFLQRKGLLGFGSHSQEFEAQLDLPL
jgi:hypothetical protein